MEHREIDTAGWLEARKRLLAKEKELTRLRDELSKERQSMPWRRVEKAYVFEGCQGKVTLAELFQQRSQLLVYHLMFAPEWETACKSCSFWADGFSSMVPHLAARDVTFVAISRAPKPKLQAFAQRMGWTFPWLSSGESDFNYDFDVSFTSQTLERGAGTYNYGPLKYKNSDMPGFSVFSKDETGAIFHTYSSYARGIELANPTYQLLDMVPRGRDEDGLPMPMTWVKLRDQYGV